MLPERCRGEPASTSWMISRTGRTELFPQHRFTSGPSTREDGQGILREPLDHPEDESDGLMAKENVVSNETHVTVRGFVGAVPAVYGNESNKCTVVIRVGVTARSFNREAGEYQPGTTAWYSVRCHGPLGTNVSRCVRKGSPVLVRGRLVPRSWTDKNNQTHIEFNILADSVGIELGTGIANFIHAREGNLPRLEGEPGGGVEALVAGPDPHGSQEHSATTTRSEASCRTAKKWRTRPRNPQLRLRPDPSKANSPVPGKVLRWTLTSTEPRRALNPRSDTRWTP